MTNSELMHAAMHGGLDDDATTAAALDAIREESGCSLLAAVMEVARVWNAIRDARDHTEATMHLSEKSPIRHALNQSILAECHNVPPGALSTVVVIEGDQFPRAELYDAGTPMYELQTATVTVGALWVKREASRLQVEHQRDTDRRRRRRSN